MVAVAAPILVPRDFILAGNATFTLRSMRTGVRYTYKVVKAEERPNAPATWFVKRLFGSDNERDYRYVGFIRDDQFFVGRNVNAEETPVVAIRYYLERCLRGVAVANVEFSHAGRCGRCGRLLTVPESIASGFGPECINRLHE
jgi:hypothetical protein